MATELQVMRRNRILTVLHKATSAEKHTVLTTRKIAEKTALKPGEALKELKVLEKVGLVRGFFRKVETGQGPPAFHWLLVPGKSFPGKFGGVRYSLLNDDLSKVRDG